jgi:hypothetical protein
VSQGDKWITPDGREGIEVRRDDKYLYLSIIVPLWPFPTPPEPFLRRVCRLAPMKYYGGNAPVDVEDALL